jgi:hypothetical protein
MSTQISISGALSSNLVYVQTKESNIITGLLPTSLIATGIGSGIGSLTILKDTLQVGSTYRFIMGGIADVSSVAGQNIKFDIGLSTQSFASLSYPSPASNNGNAFQLECTFTVKTTGVAGVAGIMGTILFSSMNISVGTSPSQSGTSFSIGTTFDTTVNNTLFINGYFSTALVTNKMISNILTLEKLK